MGYKDIEPKHYDGVNDEFISIIIPTRNEAENIKNCLESIVVQDYKNYEVIVVDGDSTDGTRNLLDDFSKRFPKVKWEPENPLKKGWVGKSFACHQGAKIAKGDWLFFIDADTIHHASMINSVISHIKLNKLDFFSLMTGQKMASLWENIILPNVFLWFGTKFPIRKVNNPKSPVARATGQFIAIKKDVYIKTSGHEAIKHKVVEDFAFSNLVKSAGYLIGIAGGRKVVSTRMYRNFSQIWEGFSKNIFFAAGESALSTFNACIYVLVTQIIPFILPFLLFFINTPDTLLIVVSFIPLLIVFCMRIELNRLLGLSHKYIFTIPIGGVITMSLHINSAYKYLSGIGMPWKGRTYLNKP